jgi:hypothetical protein
VSETAAACLAIEEDLSALIDEELAPEREAELRAHLETCDRCARRLEELCNVDLVLASLPAPEVASDLRPQLAQRIAEHERREALSAVPARREERPRQAPPPRARRWLGRRVAALAALAAAALLAIFATLRSGEAPAPDVPQIARPAPQALPAQGPEPGAEQRGEPLLAEQRSMEPVPALVEPAPPTQPEAARVELAELPPPAREAAPVEIAEAPLAVGLEDLSEEDLALLLVLDAVEDLDVIANLELLENLRELEGMEGAG